MASEAATDRYLADRIAIQDLVFSYNHALDDRDPQLVASLFAADAAVGDKSGAEAIMEAFRQTWAKFTVLHHLTSNVVVHIDGDRASGRSKSMVFRGDAAVATAESPTYVSYEDEFIRTPDGWRFLSRNFTAHPATPPRAEATPVGGPGKSI